MKHTPMQLHLSDMVVLPPQQPVGATPYIRIHAFCETPAVTAAMRHAISDRRLSRATSDISMGGNRSIMSQVVRHSKFGVPVRIAMSDRTQIIGVVFVRQNQRVIEVLCDERTFFPVETTDSIRLINKRHVVQVDLLPIEGILEKRDLFPDIDVHYLRDNNW